jgi:hypothetical protein
MCLRFWKNCQSFFLQMLFHSVPFSLAIWANSLCPLCSICFLLSLLSLAVEFLEGRTQMIILAVF